MELSCLAANGHLERVSRAVYRTSGAPSMREETVWVTRLSLEPAALAHSRDPLACAVSHNTAAWLMGLGELDPEPLSNMCSQRVSRGGAMCHGGICVMGMTRSHPLAMRQIRLAQLSPEEDASFLVSLAPTAVGSNLAEGPDEHVVSGPYPYRYIAM